MNHCKHIFFSIVLIFGCTKGEKQDEFKITTTNASQELLTIEMYDIGGLFQSIELPPNSENDCSYFAIDFFGLSNCNNSNRGLDSIVVKFQNGKGYSCKSQTISDSCLPNKNLFTDNEQTFEQIGEREYRFTITQEDFENAFELPDQ